MRILRGHRKQNVDAPATPVSPAAPALTEVPPVETNVFGGAPTATQTPPPVSSRPLAPKKEADSKPTSVSTLSHVELPARFQSAELKLDLPLKAGTWSLPLGDKTAVIEVPEGCSLHVEAQVDGSGASPTLTGASMKSTQPLRVKNAEDLVDLGIPLSNVAGKIVGAVLDVQLSGFTVEKDGRVVPELAVVGPELNPLKRLKGDSTHVQRLPVVKSLMPKLNVDARQLLSGDLFPDAYSAAVAKPIQPRGLDLKALLGGVGAMAGEGHVELKLRTDVGDVSLAKGAIGVRHDASPMELKVSGDFLVGQHGELSSKLTGSVDTEVVDASFTAQVNAQASPTGLHGSAAADAKVKVDSGEGKISVGHGAFTATHAGDVVQVTLGGKLLELAQGVGGAMKVKLGDQVTAKLDAEVAAGADFGLDVTPDGIAVSAQDAKAEVTAGGLSLAAPNYDVVLGAGSQLEMEAGKVTLDPTRGLSVTDSQGRFELSVPSSRVKLGMLTGAADGVVEGRVDLKAATSEIDARADARLTGRGGLGRFLLPVDVDVERKLAVTLSGDAVDVQRV